MHHYSTYLVIAIAFLSSIISDYKTNIYIYIYLQELKVHHYSTYLVNAAAFLSSIISDYTTTKKQKQKQKKKQKKNPTLDLVYFNGTKSWTRFQINSNFEFNCCKTSRTSASFFVADFLFSSVFFIISMASSPAFFYKQILKFSCITDEPKSWLQKLKSNKNKIFKSNRLKY